jgi:hypothetical protein
MSSRPEHFLTDMFYELVTTLDKGIRLRSRHHFPQDYGETVDICFQVVLFELDWSKQ